MGEKKLTKQPAARLTKGERQRAQKETMKLFEKTKLTAAGRREVRRIFNSTTDAFLKERAGEGRWQGTLRRFVLCCSQMIALELEARARKAGSKGCSDADVFEVAVKWMLRFKGLNPAACKAYLKDQSGRTGAVCDPFLDKI